MNECTQETSQETMKISKFPEEKPTNTFNKHLQSGKNAKNHEKKPTNADALIDSGINTLENQLKGHETPEEIDVISRNEIVKDKELIWGENNNESIASSSSKATTCTLEKKESNQHDDDDDSSSCGSNSFDEHYWYEDDSPENFSPDDGQVKSLEDKPHLNVETVDDVENDLMFESEKDDHFFDGYNDRTSNRRRNTATERRPDEYMHNVANRRRNQSECGLNEINPENKTSVPFLCMDNLTRPNGVMGNQPVRFQALTMNEGSPLTPKAPQRRVQDREMNRVDSPRMLKMKHKISKETIDNQKSRVEEPFVYEFALWKKASKNNQMKKSSLPGGKMLFSSQRKELPEVVHDGSTVTDTMNEELMKNSIDSILVHKTIEDYQRSSSSPTIMQLKQSNSPTLTSSRKKTFFDDETDVDENTVPNYISWKLGEIIGEGSFGKVFKVLDRNTGEMFAAKKIEIPRLRNSDDQLRLSKLEEEISLMENLDHQHIVRYRGTDRRESFFYIFMEYVPGGSIASMLTQFDVFNEDLIRLFVRQILKGVQYLHSKGIVHRDIKGANVLVNEQGVAKLADFGCSKQLHTVKTKSLEESLCSIRGSVPWMAPEVIKQTGHGIKADIWSVGATIIEMASARHPWPANTNNLTAMYAIATTKTSPPIPPTLSKLAHQFLDRCFCVNPEERACATELLNHPFLHVRDRRGSGK